MTTRTTSETAGELSGVRYLVTGRVQGVGFRWWTRSTAERLGLAGSVRNLDDGSVEVRAFGSPAALGELRSALQQGPAGANVTGITETNLSDPTPALPFQISR